MKQLNKTILAIPASVTIALNAKANDLIAKGEKVLKFGIGEPDFNTPDNVKEAGKKAIDANRTKYTAESGVPELKDAISKKLKRENGLDYSPKQVIASCGAKHSLYNAFAVLLSPGDEVIIPNPAWFTFAEQVKMFSGKPVFVDNDENYKIVADNIAEAITEKTKAILVNSPSNPSGSIIEKNELEKIAELAVEKDIYVISDECYEHFIYDGKKHYSIASFGDEIKKLTLTINAVSKTYAMTGWRIGYMAAEESIVKAASNLQSQSASHPTSISQYAAVEALNGDQSSVKKMCAEFDKRRQAAYEGFRKIEGIVCPKPEGAFYVFPKVSGLYNSKIRNSVDFCSYMLDSAKVALVPGLPFGRDDCIRFSYASSMENIKEGLERIEKAVGGI